MEPVSNAIRVGFPDLNHSVCLTLLKIRMLGAFRAIEQTRVAGSEIPQELIDSMKAKYPLTTRNGGALDDLADGNSLQSYIDTLESHIGDLYTIVNKANKHFWPALLDPEDHLYAGRPDMYGPGSIEDMELALMYNYRAWAETPGAIEIIGAKMQSGA